MAGIGCIGILKRAIPYHWLFYEPGRKVSTKHQQNIFSEDSQRSHKGSKCSDAPLHTSDSWPEPQKLTVISISVGTWACVIAYG
jgi:hypothetical protein